MNSIGITTSCPYVNLNGVCPVNFLLVVLYSHNTVGIFKSQSSQLTLQTFVSACSRILLNASTIPFSEDGMVCSSDDESETPLSMMQSSYSENEFLDHS
jgi:hypothetical protein